MVSTATSPTVMLTPVANAAMTDPVITAITTDKVNVVEDASTAVPRSIPAIRTRRSSIAAM